MTNTIPRIITFDTLNETMDWFTDEDNNIDADLVVYVIPLVAECAGCDSDIEPYTAAYLLRGCPRVICQDCFNQANIVLDQFSQERIIATEEQYR